MRFLAAVVSVLVWSATAHAAPEGAWHCTQSNPPGSTTFNFQFVGAKIVETNMGGDRRLVPDQAISDDYVVWSTSVGRMIDFYPKEGRLEYDKGGEQARTFRCERQP